MLRPDFMPQNNKRGLLAVEMMKSRTQIEGLQQVKHTLELGLEDLVEEVTRFQEKNQKQGK